jgi:hypothetical protein
MSCCPRCGNEGTLWRRWRVPNGPTGTFAEEHDRLLHCLLHRLLPLASYTDILRCFSMSRCVSMCLDVSRCVSMCLGVSRCVSVCLGASRCFSVFLDVSLFLDASRCVSMCFGVSRCVLVSLSVSLCVSLSLLSHLLHILRPSTPSPSVQDIQSALQRMHLVSVKHQPNLLICKSANLLIC